MDYFKDLNELISVARQINEGKYNLIGVSLDPSNELFSIAQYFNDSVKKLKTVSSSVGGSYENLPAFESVLHSIINDSKKASEDVLEYVDKINFNLDEITEVLMQVSHAVAEEDYSTANGLANRMVSLGTDGEEVCFDIVSSLEFQDRSHHKTDKLIEAVSALEEQLARLVIALGLKQQKITAENVDKLKDPKEILQDQALVNELLKEFGL